MSAKLDFLISKKSGGIAFTYNDPSFANSAEVVLTGLAKKYSKLGFTVSDIRIGGTRGNLVELIVYGDADVILDRLQDISSKNPAYKEPQIQWLGNTLAKGSIIIEANTSIPKLTSVLESIGYEFDLNDYTKPVQEDLILQELNLLKTNLLAEGIKCNYQGEKYQRKSNQSLLNITLRSGLTYFTYYMEGKMKITFNKLETTAGVFEDAEFEKGDRVIVNWGTTKEPECYLATIIQVSKKNRKVRVEFDDGHREVYPIDNKGSGIIGYCNHKRKIKREIPIDKVDDMLDQDLWFSASLRDVNKPGFTLKAFQGKTPKAAKKLSVPNTIIKSEQPKVSYPTQLLKELKRILFNGTLNTYPGSRGAKTYVWEFPDASYTITIPKNENDDVTLVSSADDKLTRLFPKGKLSYDSSTIEPVLNSLSKMGVRPLPKEEPKIDTTLIKQVAKERLVEVQLSQLSKDQKQAYQEIEKARLPPMQRIWYATEDTDLAFDFGRFQICQSDLDGAWYIVEVIGSGAKAGHKYHEETRSFKKVLKQAQELAKHVTASLTDLELERIFTDNREEVEAEIKALAVDDLPYSYQEVDSRLDPLELTSISAPRYIFSLFNTKISKQVVKRNVVGYDAQRVHHFYCSRNPSLPSAFTEALFSYAISLGANCGISLGYQGSYEEIYQQLLEDYSDGVLQVKVTYL